MSRNKKLQYVKLINFDNEANAVLNKAIQYAINEKCNEVSTVHLFLSLLDNTNYGEEILNKLDMSFETFYDSYQMLALQEEYGISENPSSLYDLDNLTQELFNIIAVTTANRAIRGKTVSPESLFDTLLESKTTELQSFLNYMDISYEDLDYCLSGNLDVPDELRDFIEDMNITLSKNTEQIYGVETYVDYIIKILTRKTNANPCLVGESGVGKTTIVKQFVKHIIDGNVPNWLKDTHVIYINSSLLTSGTKFRGDFEARMKTLLDWAANNNVILFLDELHTFIDLGKNGDSSSDTAGNMIKKYLSDGDIKIIGATTRAEYHKYLEKDKAFDRRLQVIDIKEPSVADTIKMVENTVSNYEEYHGVKVNRDIITDVVKLADRYLKDKHFPDKAYKIIDHACAEVRVQNKKIVGLPVIERVISEMSGIDIKKLSTAESKQLMSLEKLIGKRLIGQKEAVDTVSKAIRRSKSGVREPNKPVASLLFVGPTGVGKTELCKVLHDELALSKEAFIKVDMSEYGEKHSISKLIGTAPGYIGYGEGGQLTEKVKHNPYSLILFDEIEKAHPDVFNTFLQLLDEGKLTDGEGETVDFTNCIVIMTSNAGYGADGMNKKTMGFGNSTEVKSYRDKEKIAMKALEESFRPEFINRFDNIVIFEKLTKEECSKITQLMLDKIIDRLRDKGINLKLSEDVISKIVEAGYSDKYGARNLRREIQDTVEDLIADFIILNKAKENIKVELIVVDDEIVIKGD